MPMDDHTKALARALLDQHPRGYAAEDAGFAVTNTAAGLFRLLCLAILARDSAPAGPAVAATRALFAKGWGSAPEMAKVSEEQLTDVIAGAGAGRLAERV